MTSAPKAPRHGAGAEGMPSDRADVVIHPPVLWLLLLAAGIGLDHLVPLPFVPAGVPAGWVGGAVWFAGFGLAAMAIREFRRAGTDVRTHTPTAAVVETGPFAFSRNPIYVGALIGLAGAAVVFDSLWVLAMLLPFGLVVRYGVVAREEAYLERKFGDAYRAYQARVRRWL